MAIVQLFVNYLLEYCELTQCGRIDGPFTVRELIAQVDKQQQQLTIFTLHHESDGHCKYCGGNYRVGDRHAFESFRLHS